MKTVLIDFSHYADLCGFGEIARNYMAELTKMDVPELHFVFILPKKYRGTFGDKYDYIDREDKAAQLKKYDKHIDLWHATDQQYHLRGGDSNTIQLLTVHDLNFLQEKKHVHKWRHILQLRHRIRHSDYLTTISHYVRKDIEQHGFLCGKPIEVIYNGINSDDDNPGERPDFVASDDEKFFFTVGQIREKKNFHTLVPMMKHFKDYKLYICGDDHFKYAQSLRQLIADEGEGRVMLTGKISDANKIWLFRHAAAFLFPSRLEGFGIPVLEAMRYRCKVFSSRLSSLPEVCGEHADYWDDFAPEKMAVVVESGISTWQRESQEATDCREYSLKFNYKNYAMQYVELYKKLLK